MKQQQSSWAGRAAQALVAAAWLAGPSAALAEDVIDVGEQMPQAQAIKDGLFPEDECQQLKEAGFKCMGFKPAVRFSLPATSFRLGSADLPDLLRRQLDVFAEVLRSKKGSAQTVRIEGHADASGAKDANQTLSQRRAEAVKQYLVKNGADGSMLQAVGLGDDHPKAGTSPLAAENRRVEFGRATPP